MTMKMIILNQIEKRKDKKNTSFKTKDARRLLSLARQLTIPDWLIAPPASKAIFLTITYSRS